MRSPDIIAERAVYFLDFARLIRTFNKPMFTRSNQAAEAETGNLGL